VDARVVGATGVAGDGSLWQTMNLQGWPELQ